MRLRYYVPFFFLLSLGWSAESVAQEVSVYFPVTKQCYNYTKTRLEGSTTKHYQARFQKFLLPLMEARSVIGFVEISSNQLDKRKLWEIWLEIGQNCYANSSASSSINSDVIDFLKKQEGIEKVLGADVNGDRLILYYNRNTQVVK